MENATNNEQQASLPDGLRIDADGVIVVDPSKYSVYQTQPIRTGAEVSLLGAQNFAPIEFRLIPRLRKVTA